MRDRDKYQRLRCPQCRTILGSLAWQDPGLAAEWSPNNPFSGWYVRPHSSTDFLPEWICSTNSSHVWQAPLSGRSNGAECPECREFGKSKVELDHHRAAMEVFGRARSGVILRDKHFQTRASWTTDISVKTGDHYLIIEYDGAYWHSSEGKILVDTRKSEDLLAAGDRVVRLREDNLPPLPLDHECYHEIRVYSVAPQPHKVMNEMKAWPGLGRLDELDLASPQPLTDRRRCPCLLTAVSRLLDRRMRAELCQNSPAIPFSLTCNATAVPAPNRSTANAPD